MMKFVKINGVQVAYAEAGTGLPVVFVHGFPLSHRLWKPQLAGLQDMGRMIALDLPGHGESESRTGAYLMDQVAGDVNALLDALEINTPVVLCGLSLGGYMLGQFCAHYGSRLAGLIFAATRASGDSPETKLNRDRLVGIAQSGGVNALVETLLPKFMAPDTYLARPELVEELRSIMQTASLDGAVGDLLGMKARPDTFDLIAQIRLPTLVIHGTEDQLIPLSEAQRLCETIPGSCLITIPGAGHLPNLEQPELFNQAVREFLEQL
jgi:pimeloyl-ACP methyl ester carboxylesterase